MRLKIIRAGLLDTVQDDGRYGYQHLGINPGGAMDRFSASLANALLGNELAAPVIEMHFPASAFLFDGPCVVCLTGADFTPTVNGVSVPHHQPLFINGGAVLKFDAPKTGTRCYLALLNEWRLPKWLNSYSTNLKAAAGGYKGRKLMKGDELRFASLPLSQTDTGAFVALPWRYNQPVYKSNDIGFLLGNEWTWLDTKSQTALLNNRFTITTVSDRMGYRLQGEALHQRRRESLISSAVSFGTMQLLSSGQLIVLMADHQTTGGYPRIGHVITAHLSTLAQMKPGEELKFVMTTIERAEEKAALQRQALSRLQNNCSHKMQNFLHAH